MPQQDVVFVVGMAGVFVACAKVREKVLAELLTNMDAEPVTLVGTAEAEEKSFVAVAMVTAGFKPGNHTCLATRGEASVYLKTRQGSRCFIYGG
jgi:hypothetical protein